MVLAHSSVDLVLAKDAERLEQLVELFAEPDHQPRFRHDLGVQRAGVEEHAA